MNCFCFSVALVDFRLASAHSEVTTQGLLLLNGLKQGLEVASAEALMVPPLDNFQEKCGAILQWLGKDLQKITLFVVVDEDLLPLQDVNVLLHLQVYVAQTSSQLVVVGVGDLIEEHNTTGLHAKDGLNDVLGAHSDVLNTRASIVVAELLDLTLSLAIGRFVDGHLDLLVEVSHHDGAQRRELGVDHLVIDRPESMEVEHLLVPLSDRFHFSIWLVTDAVIDVEKLGNGNQAVQGLTQVMSGITWQEWAGVFAALHKGVDGVSVSFDTSEDHRAVLIRDCLWGTDACGTFGDGLVVDTCSIVDGEGDILNTISVLIVVSGEFGVVGVKR